MSTLILLASVTSGLVGFLIGMETHRRISEPCTTCGAAKGGGRSGMELPGGVSIWRGYNPCEHAGTHVVASYAPAEASMSSVITPYRTASENLW